MSFKIVRNDIVHMKTDAIVNTANDHPTVGTGCDSAVYKAAGYDDLLAYRREKIGFVPEGQAFITPAFGLQARYIIHAVSPKYRGGEQGEEARLRSCYRESLRLAREHGIRSLAFPLISTGGFGYPREEGMRIAVDEISSFLLQHEMEIYLVVFDDKTRSLGRRIDPDLEEYIDQHYVEDRFEEEYGAAYMDYQQSAPSDKADRIRVGRTDANRIDADRDKSLVQHVRRAGRKWFGAAKDKESREDFHVGAAPTVPMAAKEAPHVSFEDAIEEHESRLEERMRHLSDTFSQYLMYLIRDKKMENAEVYKRAIVDKKTFSKIKNNEDYHPKKLTALCLCVGARLNLDESKDLLARAGYALSPCDKTDIIFSYFIENEIYDMIELDIQLEEHGLPCIIS